jgi:transketolase N-terminal domain/subunit
MSTSYVAVNKNRIDVIEVSSSAADNKLKNVQIFLDTNRYQKNRESLEAAACDRLFAYKRRK